MPLDQQTTNKLKGMDATLAVLVDPITPAPTVTVKPPPVATFLMLAVHPEEWLNYQKLETARTHVAMVTLAYDKNDAVITGFDQQHIPYYFCAATSGFLSFGTGKSEYIPIADVREVLLRPACEGIIFGEMLTWIGSTLGYNMPAAAAALDWNWITQVVDAARAVGKKVVWSEPVGWDALLALPAAMTPLSHYGDTVIPMFATNFDNAGASNHLHDAVTNSVALAKKYGMPLGISHQSWYFETKNIAVTRANSMALAQLGQGYGATYYEVEGPADYMLWSNPYMQGIADFVATL